MKYRVFVLDTFKQSRNYYLTKFIHEALHKHNNVEFVSLGSYANAVEKFREYKCDIFIAFGGHGGDLNVISRIIELSKVSVLWTTEDPYELKNNIIMSKYFDIVYSNDRASLAGYEGKAQHLPLASRYNDTIKRRNVHSYDLFFMGTAWPNRVRTVNGIFNKFGSGLNFKLSLPTNPYLPKVVIENPDIIYDWRASNDNFLKFSDSSKITLGINRDFTSSKGGVSMGSTPPPRVFEIASRGNFQIVPFQSGELFNYYEEGSEIVTYRNQDELNEKIEYYSHNEKERIVIADRAFKKTMSLHTYDNRVSRILEDAKEYIENNDFIPVIDDKFKSNLLIVTHNILGNRQGGGVEVYQSKLEFNKYNIIMLYPKQNNTWEVITGNNKYEYTVPSLQLGTINNDSIEKVFQFILVNFEIDIVHFQHLLGFPLSLPLFVKSLGIPSLFTMHDYYLICDRFNLLNHANKYCNVIEEGVKKCETCSLGRGMQKDSISRRRTVMIPIINSFNKIIFNSNFTKNYLQNIYPLLSEERLVIHEMITPKNSFKYRKNISTKKKIKVAILGNFTSEKGADDYLTIFEQLNNENIEFTIFSSVSSYYQKSINDISDSVFFNGGYGNNELTDLLYDFDVSLHLSIWPETYMITLNEAIDNGLVPIIYDVGAPAERIIHKINGIKIPLNNTVKVIKYLRSFIEEPTLLNNYKKENELIRNSFITEHIHSEMLESTYDKLISLNRGAAHTPNLKFTDLNVRTNSSNWITSNSIVDDSFNDVKFSQNEKKLPHYFNYHLQSIDKLYFDECIFENSYTKVKGWAIPSFNVNYVYEVYVQFKSEGKSRIYKCELNDRKDVSKELELNYSKLGFSAIFEEKIEPSLITVYINTDLGCFTNNVPTQKCTSKVLLNNLKDEPENIIFNIDCINNNLKQKKYTYQCNSEFIIDGWAYNTLKSTPLLNSYILLEGIDNDKKYIYKVQFHHRIDVVEYYDDTSFLLSGFNLKVNLDVEISSYKVYLVEINESEINTKTYLNLNLQVVNGDI